MLCDGWEERDIYLLMGGLRPSCGVSEWALYQGGSTGLRRYFHMHRNTTERSGDAMRHFHFGYH